MFTTFFNSVSTSLDSSSSFVYPKAMAPSSSTVKLSSRSIFWKLVT